MPTVSQLSDHISTIFQCWANVVMLSGLPFVEIKNKNKLKKINNDSSFEKYSSRLHKYNIEFKIADNCNKTKK